MLGHRHDLDGTVHARHSAHRHRRCRRPAADRLQRGREQRQRRQEQLGLPDRRGLPPGRGGERGAGGGDTGEVPVSITNQSKTCTLENFPAVTLSQKGVSGKLSAQKGATAQKLKLAKGEAATFTISYVRGKDGDATSLAASEMKITLPGGDSAQTFPWKYGPIAGQGAPNKPNASVSAFQQAGD